MSTTASISPIHPGEILAEEYLAPLKITQHKLAVDIGVPPVESTRSYTVSGASARTRHCGSPATSARQSGSG